MSNKKKIIILGTCLVAFVFVITYTCTVLVLNNKVASSKENINKSEKIKLDNNSESIKIVYESTYLGDEAREQTPVVDEYIEKFNNEKNLIKEMTKEQVADAFKKEDYALKDIEKDKIVFARNVGKYKYNPNKYVIGIKDTFLAIYKTDHKGQLLLESSKDVTNIKTSELTQGDIELLQIGDEMYEFDNKRDAQEALQGMFRS